MDYSKYKSWCPEENRFRASCEEGVTPFDKQDFNPRREWYKNRMEGYEDSAAGVAAMKRVRHLEGVIRREVENGIEWGYYYEEFHAQQVAIETPDGERTFVMWARWVPVGEVALDDPEKSMIAALRARIAELEAKEKPVDSLD